MLSRRLLLFAAAGAITAFHGSRKPAVATEENDGLLRLWPTTPPGGGGPSGAIIVNSKGAVNNIAVPTIERFRPARPNGAAMLIAAGGGYKRIEQAMEAQPAAHWLAERGVTAFVLTYRLPVEGWENGPLAPLQDAQRALRMIRALASAEGLDPARIGVFGFSAGGHLLGLAATRSAFRSYQPIDAVDEHGAQADRMVLAYPVITVEPPYDDTSTRRSLIGRHPSPHDSAEWSVQTHVRRHCPPTFLVQAADDPISNLENTAIMRQACEHAGVPVERLLLPSGGHGFGMGKPGSQTQAWPEALEAWLRQTRFI